MNEKQKLILRKLVEINGQKYSQLYKNFSEEDKFPYHLKYLLKQGLIKKRDLHYYLTKKGMKATSTFDTVTLAEVSYPMPLLLFICKYQDKFLVSKHFGDDSNEKRHLFALPSAKPLWGKTLEQSCRDEFLRKTGITADFIYQKTFHLVHKTTDGDTLFDNIFLIFKCEIDNNEFLKCKKKYWLTKEEMTSLPNLAITLKRLVVEEAQDVYMQEEITYNYGIEESDL